MAKNNSPILEFGVQSFSLTSYSRYENKLLMLIFKYFQSDFSDAITQQTQQKSNLPVFSPEEEGSRIRYRKVELRHLEPRKGHYARAREALTSMSQKPIYIPYYNKRKKLDYAGYHQLFLVDFTVEGNKCMVNLKVSIDLLKYYMSIAMGYHRIDLDEMLAFVNNSTQQLYRLYYAYFARGKNKLNPVFVANVLSCNGKYETFSSIRCNLLDPAQKEMDLAFDQGKSRIRFTFRPYYDPNSPSRRLPDKIQFSFFDESDENPSGDRLAELNTAQRRYSTVLKTIWGVCEPTVSDIVKRIQVWMLPELDNLMEAKLNFVKEKERINKNYFRNKSGYIITVMNKFLAAKEKELGDRKKQTEERCPGNSAEQLF